MNSLLYSKIKEIKRELRFSEFYSSDNKEEIKNYLLGYGFEDSKEFDEAVSFVVKWNEATNTGNYNYLEEVLRDDFSNMEQEELKETLITFFDEKIYDDELLKSVPNVEYLLELFANIDDLNKYKVIKYVEESDLVKYLDNNEENSRPIIDYLVKASDISSFQYIMDNSKNDHIKFEMVIKFDEPRIWLPYIKEPYHRRLIIEQSDYDGPNDPNDLVDDMKIYDMRKKELSEISDEREKAIYISKLRDKHMMDIFLSGIKDKDNRKLVIDSYERNVEEDIKPLDELAQKMIREYFEDTLGENYSDEKREIVERILKSTDVYFCDLEPNINGKACYCDRAILIAEKHHNYNNRNLGILLHEYAHIFSNRDYPFTGEAQNRTIEEGMADLFGDLVVNHYIEKHQNVELNGRPFRIDRPYKTYSGYDFEAAWPRAMLYGLESKGEDKRSIGEYLIGDKLAFAEMVFGEEEVNRRKLSEYGTPNLNTSVKELYYSPELDFSTVNRKYIYYERNYLLPAYELQNRMGDKADIVGILNDNQSYYADYIAQEYFEGRKFYEVPKEELGDFIWLINKQVFPNGKASPIQDVYGYPIVEISKLSQEEIEEHSFEILDNIPVLFGATVDIKHSDMPFDPALEKVIELSFTKEIKRIREGQDIKDTTQKKEKLVRIYRDIFPDKKDEYTYINEWINDFEFECEQQRKDVDSNDDRDDI